MVAQSTCGWLVPGKSRNLDDMKEAIPLRAVAKKFSQCPSDDLQRILRDGLFLKPLTDLHKPLSTREKQTLVAIVSDGLFTNFDLFRMGYDIDPCRERRGGSHDSIFHRCYSCPAIEHGASEAP